MTTSEFEEFKIKSQSTYAADLAKAEDISIEDASKHTYEQFKKLVPDGIKTSGQLFFQVVKKDSQQSLGYLWLGFQNRFGRKVISINDIAINTTYRRQGFGKLLMELVEQEAKRHEAVYIRLHVFNHNEVAKQLYLSQGFNPSSIDMKKEL